MASSWHLILVATLALALLPAIAEAQGYWVVYPSSCPAVCGYANPSNPYSGYTACYNQCTNCLLYWGCYSSFIPYFSYVTNPGSPTVAVNTYLGSYQCGCYWPWWAWTILGVGLFVIVFVCLPFAVVYFCCKGAMKMAGKGKDTETHVAEQPYSAQPAPYPAQAAPYPAQAQPYPAQPYPA